MSDHHQIEGMSTKIIRMLTAAQTAVRLGLSPRKVYDLAASGCLACYRFDGSIRFDPADVEAYKTSCRLPSTRATSAGTTNLSASLPVKDNALAAYFRRAGLGSKLTNSTGSNRPGSTRLQLVSQSHPRR